MVRQMLRPLWMLLTLLLRNGIQISVKADGILEWDRHGGGGRRSRVRMSFNNARNATGKNFIDVSKFPVSYIQLSVPQGAREGVGVDMLVVMMEPSPVEVSPSSDRQSVMLGRPRAGKRRRPKKRRIWWSVSPMARCR